MGRGLPGDVLPYGRTEPVLVESIIGGLRTGLLNYYSLFIKRVEIESIRLVNLKKFISQPSTVDHSARISKKSTATCVNSV